MVYIYITRCGLNKIYHMDTNGIRMVYIVGYHGVCVCIYMYIYTYDQPAIDGFDRCWMLVKHHYFQLANFGFHKCGCLLIFGLCFECAKPKSLSATFVWFVVSQYLSSHGSNFLISSLSSYVITTVYTIYI